MTTDDVSVLKSPPLQELELPFSSMMKRDTDLLNSYSQHIGELRKAAAEALLSGALVLADVQRDPNWSAERITKESEQRFRKALEELARALG